MSEAKYDIAIIGSGPAGLSAAIYASRGNAKTLILAGNVWGGQLMLTTGVENYPGFESIDGPELMDKMKSHATKFGAEFKSENVVSVDFNTSPFLLNTSSGSYNAKSVIIATGANIKWLDLPSEQKLIGRGVSSCAPCDAPFFRDKNVIVVGGGDSAMEEALVLSKFATSVTIIHRRDSFRASKIMQDRVIGNPKVKVIWDSLVHEVLGDVKVTGATVKNIKTGEVTEMPIDGIFVAIGHEPATEVFREKLELDAKGYIKKVHHEKYQSQNDDGEIIGNRFNMMTSVEGVFTAGDVHDYHYKQAITAAGFGCQAALEALAWLDEAK